MHTTKQRVKAAVIIVAYGHENSIKTTLDAIQTDKQPGDTVIIVDNHPSHLSARVAETHPTVDKVIRSENDGFGAGCNKAAEQAGSVDMLYFLNPDAVPRPKFLSESKKAYTERPEWAAWMSLLVLSDGKVNSAGNVVHISGLSWVASFGSDSASYAKPQEVSVLSGACMAVRADVWKELGGFTEEYFLYYEDTELSTRMQLKGYKLGLWPASKVMHDYEFKNGAHKWLYLERNRYLYILTCWPAAVIIVLSPVILVSELGLWLISVLQHRFMLRLKSVLMLIEVAPSIPAFRKRALKNRSISSKELLQSLAADLHNPFLGKISDIELFTKLFTAYKSIALKLLP